MVDPKGSNNRAWGLVVGVALITAITAFHYMTESHEVAFHNVYRRLYYLPIVILAFSHGWVGGLVSAAIASLLYVPHAFFMHHHDPAPAVDKVLEIVLYFAVGGLTGWLVGRQERAQRELERSVAEREALERQLVRAGKLSALGQLTSGLAHEIRNPLASILGAAEAVATECPEGHRKHRMAELLLKEIHRLNRVVDDFLRFARPGQALDEEVDLLEVALEVRDLTGQQARASGAEVVIGLEPGQAVVRGDRGQLAQVVLNVFLNAYQALDEREDGPGRIEVVARQRQIADGDYVCLGVVDDGPGVPADLQEEIFNPYFTTRPEGTGLGLSISSRIVEAHGGFMDIESEPGRTAVWACFRAHGGK